MNQKEFVKMLRLLIRSELRPIIEEVVEEVVSNEFRLLREELSASQMMSGRDVGRELMQEDDNVDLSSLFSEADDMSLRGVIERDEQQPKRQLFKESKGNVFTDMLQQTVNEGYKPGSIQSNVPQADNGQQLVQVNTPAQVPNRRSMIDAIGYGNMGQGNAASVPGNATPNVVQVPEKTPDGKPIDANAIPDFLLSAMTKDYSKTLADSKKADKMRRGL